MSQNPYEAPRSLPQAVGVKSGRREDLLEVAKHQKGIIYCILANIALGVARLATLQAVPGQAGAIAFEPTLVVLTRALVVGDRLYVRLLIADKEGERTVEEFGSKDPDRRELETKGTELKI